MLTKLTSGIGNWRRGNMVFERLREQSGILSEFTDAQLKEIVTKAHGSCYLCGDPIDFEKDSIEGDHIDADDPNRNRPENICLTHKKCNARKRDLPLSLAKKLFQLLRFSEKYQDLPSFDNVLDDFVGTNRRPIIYTICQGSRNERISINFGDSNSVDIPLYLDSASGIKYCFCEVPINNLFNDEDAQPRKITYGHVWKMLLDFTKHPVHEPSSLRLVTDPDTSTAKLKLCDGQHKALAQILLDRNFIPAKIYVDPDIHLIRTLIDTIQNRIRKLPLYPSIVMEKLSVIYSTEWERYCQDTEPPYTESRFINSFRSDQQANVKKNLLEAIYMSILHGKTDSEEHKILKFVESVKRRVGTDKIMSMNLFKKTLLKNFVFQKPCDFPVGDTTDLRLNEVANMRKFLDIFVDVFFEDDLGIKKEIDNKMKRIFKSGSIRSWVTVFQSAINNRLSVLDVRHMDKPFLRKISNGNWVGIQSILQRLEQHPIWDDDSPDVESKLNENKLETSDRLFREYSIPLDVAYLLGPR